MRYLIYARKSSESEDRQIQSIDDQVSRLKEFAANHNLTIDRILTESKSAKAPNTRPKFREMLELIETGEIDGLLCWQINRLSRNPVDSANIQWLLQQNKLKSIQTMEKEYLPSDNALLFSVESGIANQFIIDLRKNTLRGLQSKLEKGWIPCLAPTGYLNDKENKTIIKDPERFGLVRKMWDLMLTGLYTPPKIRNIVNKEWGFKTKKAKRTGGKELSNSSFYRVFTNVFYAGVIEYAGIQYQGKHETMITLEEFDRVQALLGRKGKPRPKKHSFAFTGLIRCSECGCLYTAIKKQKFIKSTKTLKEYTYYFCTRKRKDINCSQRTAIKEDALEAMIQQEIERYTILPEFKEWALKILNRANDQEIENRKKIRETQYQALNSTEKQLDNLTKMRYRELITDEEYIKERSTLNNQITELKSKVKANEDTAEKWLELTEKTFIFATNAREAFINGNLETKKAILMALGKNPIIKDGKLSITAHEWLQPISDGYKELENQYLRLEPRKLIENIANNESLNSLNVMWGG